MMRHLLARSLYHWHLVASGLYAVSVIAQCDDGLVVCNDLYVITCKMVSGCMWKFCHLEEDDYYVHDSYICVIGRYYVDFLSLTR